ncbi:MAG: HNH endonuclease signature motif containing protein [Chitinophagaceae bacterium]
MEIERIIEDLVNSKVSQLNNWQAVRWEGGRLYYETTKIANEISCYPINLQILYLEKLLENRFTIQDNWPGSAPDITADFQHWIKTSITKLKLHQLSSSSSPTKPLKKRIPVKRTDLARLQQENGSECPFCQNIDVAHFEVHHIDNDPSNNIFTNLILLCPICHSKITKGEITEVTVRDIKLKLSIR